MRHLFDQYDQPENRLTHALVSSLANDPVLLKSFIRWSLGEKLSKSELSVIEQSLPGEEEPQDESDAERRGLPDGWIYDADGWSLIIESKISSPLIRDQLERHRRTAERRGFTQINILALVTDLPSPAAMNGTNVTVRKWTELYCWLKGRSQSEWAGRLASYMEVLEQKLVQCNYLREGTLTVFAGIPFGKEVPYTYLEAKRLLRLAMDELRKREDLQEELGMDAEAVGRSAITGRDGIRIWDFLRLRQSRNAESFTEFPHLTLSIHSDQLLVIVTVPNGIRREFRRNLLAGGKDEFRKLFRIILEKFSQSLGEVQGAAPWVEVVQRRYPTQRSEPILDARLQFDLRTGFGDNTTLGNAVKQQPQWLDATYDALEERNSNLQLGVGAIFPFERCLAVREPEILNHVAAVWLSCKPLLDSLLGLQEEPGK